ncbi:uncharacterized protein LOC106026187 isoform X2 [Cavia porcellus]|uniref:uncharacterized protein LOC106026187 isoform X2 n=1 Tax=Cavia porcellus TaxID=10141 RepID=UPI002FE152BA
MWPAAAYGVYGAAAWQGRLSTLQAQAWKLLLGRKAFPQSSEARRQQGLGTLTPSLRLRRQTADTVVSCVACGFTGAQPGENCHIHVRRSVALSCRWSRRGPGAGALPRSSRAGICNAISRRVSLNCPAGLRLFDPPASASSSWNCRQQLTLTTSSEVCTQGRHIIKPILREAVSGQHLQPNLTSGQILGPCFLSSVPQRHRGMSSKPWNPWPSLGLSFLLGPLYVQCHLPGMSCLPVSLGLVLICLDSAVTSSAWDTPFLFLLKGREVPERSWDLRAASSFGSCPRILECWNLNSLQPILQRRSVSPGRGRLVLRSLTCQVSWLASGRGHCRPSPHFLLENILPWDPGGWGVAQASCLQGAQVLLQ